MTKKRLSKYERKQCHGCYKFTVQNTLIDWLKQFGIAALYVLVGVVTHHDFTINGVVSVFWPGSGLALAALLIGGGRYLWGVLLGALLVNALANDTLVGALGTTLASMLEVLLGVWLLTRNDKFSSTLNTLTDYLRLIVLGGAVAGSIGAIIGVLALLLAGFITPADYFENALLWWMGDTLGVVLVTPLILTWWQTKSKRSTDKHRLEGLLLVGITFIAGQIIFLGWFHESLIVAPKAFMMFLPITWIAIRLGIRTTTFALNMVAIQALSGAFLKIGYFANEIAISGLHNYWIYMLILSVVGMAMTTYVNEINQNEFNLQKKETHLRLSQAGGGIGTWEADLVNNTQSWSESCVALLGLPAMSKPTWEDFLAIVHPEDRQRVIDATQSHIESDTTYDVEYRAIAADGNIHWIRSAGQVERDANGKPTMMRGIAQDVTERKRSEMDLRIAAIAFESQEGMFITDAHSVILRVNRAFTKITGYSAEEVIGKKPPILQSGRQNAAFYAAMWESINATGAWEGEIWNRRKTGEVYPEHLTITAVIVDSTVTHYVATLTDITLKKVSVDEIERLAFYDPLTGLPNRRLLWDRLKSALASSHRSGRKGALLFIDMDNFKIINDTLGHDMGDLLLQQVAQRLVPCVREGDTVARLSGDEFVVVLEDLSKQAHEAATQSEMIGDKILAALNKPYRLATEEYLRTSSIGVTLFEGHEQTIDELLKRADIAMYQAKSSGRNALRFFDPQMQAGITARVAMVADLTLGAGRKTIQTLLPTTGLP